MATEIVIVGGSIGIEVDPKGSISSITDPQIQKSVNSQFSDYVRDTLLGGNELTNLVGAPPPASESTVVSFAPLRFAVNSISGSLGSSQMVLAINELLEAVEALGGANLRVGQGGLPALHLEYKQTPHGWQCCEVNALQIDRDGSYMPATFAAVVHGVEYKANLQITVGWLIPTSQPALSAVAD